MIQEILKKSWKMVWKDKFLWIFGFLIFIFGELGGINLFIDFEITDSKTIDLYSVKQFFDTSVDKIINFTENFKNAFLTHPFQLFISLLFLLVLVLIFIFISLSSQGGMIYYLKNISQDKKFNFLEGIKSIIYKFRSLLGIFSLGVLSVILFFVIFVLPFLLVFLKNGLLQWFFIALLSLIIFFLPAIFIIYFIIHFAYFYLIIKEEQVISSIKKSYCLFLKNWLIVIKFTIIFFLIYILTIYAVSYILSLLNLLINLVGVSLFYSSAPNFSWFITQSGILFNSFIGLITMIFLTIFKYANLISLFNSLNKDIKKI